MTQEPEQGTAGPVVFDRAADFYDETRGFPAGAEARVAALLSEVGRLSPASRVLEVGIGTGRIALPLAERGPTLFGVDLSRPMLARLAAKRGALPVHAARADAARLPFPDACFDAAVGVHLFHLIPRWREALAELARVLRPGAPLLHGADARSETWGSWRDRFGTEHRLENVGVPNARFESFPADEGWRPRGELRRIDFLRRLRPRELVERLARRTWSMTWRLGDAELAEAVEGLRRELLQRFGDLDRPVEVEGGFWVQAWLPPADTLR